MARGLTPWAFGDSETGYGRGLGILKVSMGASDSTKYPFKSKKPPFKIEIINAWGVMTAAGGALDTVVIKNGSTAVTNTADVSTLADKDIFDFSSLNDDKYQLTVNDELSVVTVSGAPCMVYILFMRVV